LPVTEEQLSTTYKTFFHFGIFAVRRSYSSANGHGSLSETFFPFTVEFFFLLEEPESWSASHSKGSPITNWSHSGTEALLALSCLVCQIRSLITQLLWRNVTACWKTEQWDGSHTGLGL